MTGERTCPHCGSPYSDGRTHGRVREDGPVMCVPLPRAASAEVFDSIRDLLGAMAELVRALNLRDLRPREHIALRRVSDATDKCLEAISKAEAA